MMSNRKVKWQILHQKIQNFFEMTSKAKDEYTTNYRDVFISTFGSVENLIDSLETHATLGLNTSDSKAMEERKLIFGENKLPWAKCATYWQIFSGYLEDIIIILLIIFSVLVLIVQSIKLGITKNRSRDDWIELIEPIAILLVVIAVLNITTYNDYKQLVEQDKIRIASRQETLVNVVRQGVQSRIASADLCVGDIILLNYGDTLAADGICLSSFGLTLDESALTGESTELIKDCQDNFILYSPTDVTDGCGSMIVLSVGINSTYGRICRALNLVKKTSKSSDSDISLLKPIFGQDSSNLREEASISTNSGKKFPSLQRIENISQLQTNKDGHISVLQKKLAHVSRTLTFIAIFIGTAVLVFRVIMVTREYTISKNDINNPDGQMTKIELLSKILDAFQLANMVIVVAVPEGILIAITMTASIASRRMRKDGCNVQNISACETMGNATVICSDKTGTLTQNKMSVEKIFIQPNLMTSKQFLKSFHDRSLIGEEFIRILEMSILTNLSPTSHIEPINISNVNYNSDEKPSAVWKFTEKIIGNFMENHNDQFTADAQNKYKQFGNKTECALLALLCDSGINISKKISEFKKDIIRIYSFNSSRKYMSAIVKNSKDSGYFLFVKGASEILITKCNSILSPNGKIETLDNNTRSKLSEEFIFNMSNSGFRTITIAYKSLDQKETDLTNVDSSCLIKDLILISIIGIADPIRPEVPNSVECVKRAGVRVIMVTGDNLETAKHIGTICNIYDPNNSNDLAMTSSKFNEAIMVKTDLGIHFSQHNFDMIWPNLKILARSRPEDKKILVDGIMVSKVFAKSEIVAVTGDGTNDSLALKAADVGFAMGDSGTDMARNASDIIINNDNFTSIVKALLWGRNMYDAVTKFIQFQLSVNVVVLFVVILTSHEEFYPLHPIPLLWLNLLMDTLASLSLATDWPHREQLERKPRAKDSTLISKFMLRKIISHSLMQVSILLALFFSFNSIVGRTFYFNSKITVKNFESKNQFYQIRNTFIFHTLVMFTLFNEFNSRVVMGERNIFQNFTLNRKFIYVWLISFILQTIIVLFFGEFIGLISVYKLPIPDGVNSSKIFIIFWFLFLPFLIGSTSLIFEQIVLILVPNKFLRRIRKSKKSTLNRTYNSSSRSSFILKSSLLRANEHFNYFNTLENSIHKIH